MTDPILTDPVVAFYRTLDEAETEAFNAAVDALATLGPALGRPRVGEVNLRDYPAYVKGLFGNRLKELRVSGAIRVLFLFGPDRVPVLLYAGSKAGEWSRWYPGAITEATRLFREYLEELQ